MELITIRPKATHIRSGYWTITDKRKVRSANILYVMKMKKRLGVGYYTILNLQCSYCHKVTMVDDSISYNYCPHCGAKMVGENNG